MKPVIAYAALAALLTGTSLSQSAQTAPAFETADVHPNAEATSMEGPAVFGGRYALRGATMLDLIVLAYGVKADKVVGGPGWLEYDRFDITAKVATGGSPATWKLMLQKLLADRFKVAVHNETRPMPGYALRAGKKPLLKTAVASGDSGCSRSNVQGSNGLLAFSCHQMTMGAFVAGMRDMPAVSGYVTGPLIDETGLTGKWDFDFKVRQPRASVPAGENGATLFEAMQDLGLDLVPTSAPDAVLVVEGASETPTANPSDLAAKLPPLPAEFEVADLKPSDPSSKVMRFQFQPGGRVTLQGQTLKLLIQRAWGVRALNIDERLVGPKFLDSDRFDIVAKMPSLGVEEAVKLPSPWLLDLEGVAPMLRALLAQRFRITFHYEDRPLTAYALTASKPKLQKADPSGRTRCEQDVAPVENDPRTFNPDLRIMDCRNMTMAQFAQTLSRQFGGILQGAEIVDATNLEGAWDFRFSYNGSPLARLATAGAANSDPSAAPVATIPTVGDALQQAIEKQLGLKLETTKRPAQVLVLDHIEQRPVQD